MAATCLQLVIYSQFNVLSSVIFKVYSRKFLHHL